MPTTNFSPPDRAEFPSQVDPRETHDPQDTRQTRDRPLDRLANDALLSRVDELARRERRVTLTILLHLNEVERRRLHLKLGYSSLFDYCTRRLGYSASAANRRIRTARCVRRFARVHELLERNEVNLTTVSMVAGVLGNDNHGELLERIRGKTQRDVEAIVAEYQPLSSWRDRVKPVCVRVKASSTRVHPSPLFAPPTTNCTSTCEYDRNGRAVMKHRHPVSVGGSREHESAGENTAHESVERVRTNESVGRNDPNRRDESATDSNPATVRLERKFMIQFAASPEFVRKLEAARSLLSFRLPAGAAFEQVLGAVLDEYVERNSPAARRARRMKRAARHRAERGDSPNDEKAPEPAERGGSEHHPTETANSSLSSRRKLGRRAPTRQTTTAGVRAGRSRRIPAAIRDTVFARDGGHCTYVSPAGRRCGATRHLQVDHVTPFSRGGAHTTSNLQLLCAQHNRLEAERLLGEETMRQFRRFE